MKNLAPLLPNVELSDDAILKSLDKYRPDAYFDGSRPVGGGTTDDINDLRDYYRYGPKLGYGKLTQPISQCLRSGLGLRQRALKRCNLVNDAMGGGRGGPVQRSYGMQASEKVDT